DPERPLWGTVGHERKPCRARFRVRECIEPYQAGERATIRCVEAAADMHHSSRWIGDVAGTAAVEADTDARNRAIELEFCRRSPARRIAGSRLHVKFGINLERRDPRAILAQSIGRLGQKSLRESGNAIEA